MHGVVELQRRAIRARAMDGESGMLHFVLPVVAVPEPRREVSRVGRLRRIVGHKYKAACLCASCPEVARLVNGKVEHAVVGDRDRRWNPGAGVGGGKAVRRVVEGLRERGRPLPSSEGRPGGEEL